MEFCDEIFPDTGWPVLLTQTSVSVRKKNILTGIRNVVYLLLRSLPLGCELQNRFNWESQFFQAARSDQLSRWVLAQT